MCSFGAQFKPFSPMKIFSHNPILFTFFRYLVLIFTFKLCSFAASKTDKLSKCTRKIYKKKLFNYPNLNHKVYKAGVKKTLHRDCVYFCVKGTCKHVNTYFVAKIYHQLIAKWILEFLWALKKHLHTYML